MGTKPDHSIFDIYLEAEIDDIKYDLGILNEIKISADLTFNVTMYVGIRRSREIELVKSRTKNMDFMLIFHNKDSNEFFSWKIKNKVPKWLGYDDECIYMKLDYNMIDDIDQEI